MIFKKSPPLKKEKNKKGNQPEDTYNKPPPRK